MLQEKSGARWREFFEESDDRRRRHTHTDVRDGLGGDARRPRGAVADVREERRNLTTSRKTRGCEMRVSASPYHTVKSE